jgi:protein-histidine pros-kinase
LENARQQVIQNARIMMETASPAAPTPQAGRAAAPAKKLQAAKRDRRAPENARRTSEDGRCRRGQGRSVQRETRLPLAQQRAIEAQQRLIDSMKDKPGELLDSEFHPQSVPAFAATEIFGYLREKFPDYFYKEATLNPTNPRNRSTDWETDVVNQFRAENSASAEFMSTRETPGGTSLFLARPIRINNVSCLQCHSTPDKAPPEMIKLYGTANGFGWKMDEVIGAQIVSVPMSLPLNMADQSFQSLMKWLAGAFLGIGLVGNLAAAVVVPRNRQ